MLREKGRTPGRGLDYAAMANCDGSTNSDSCRALARSSGGLGFTVADQLQLPAEDPTRRHLLVRSRFQLQRFLECVRRVVRLVGLYGEQAERHPPSEGQARRRFPPQCLLHPPDRVGGHRAQVGRLGQLHAPLGDGPAPRRPGPGSPGRVSLPGRPRARSAGRSPPPRGAPRVLPSARGPVAPRATGFARRRSARAAPREVAGTLDSKGYRRTSCWASQGSSTVHSGCVQANSACRALRDMAYGIPDLSYTSRTSSPRMVRGGAPKATPAGRAEDRSLVNSSAFKGGGSGPRGIEGNRGA